MGIQSYRTKITPLSYLGESIRLNGIDVSTNLIKDYVRVGESVVFEVYITSDDLPITTISVNLGSKIAPITTYEIYTITDTASYLEITVNSTFNGKFYDFINVIVNDNTFSICADIQTYKDIGVIVTPTSYDFGVCKKQAANVTFLKLLCDTTDFSDKFFTYTVTYPNTQHLNTFKCAKPYTLEDGLSIPLIFSPSISGETIGQLTLYYAGTMIGSPIELRGSMIAELPLDQYPPLPIEVVDILPTPKEPIQIYSVATNDSNARLRITSIELLNDSFNEFSIVNIEAYTDFILEPYTNTKVLCIYTQKTTKLTSPTIKINSVTI